MIRLYSNDDLLLLDPIEVYQLKLDGKIDRFPRNFWKVDDHVNKYTCCRIVNYLFDEILGWSISDIKQKVCTQTFIQYHLAGMLKVAFNSSIYNVLDLVYNVPNDSKKLIYPWELACCPRSYWNKETAKLATKWLIEEKLKLSRKDICDTFCIQTIKSNNLGGLCCYFKGSTFEILNNAYPNEYLPWELLSCPNKYWNKDTARIATHWMLYDILKWSDEDICKKLTIRTFKENNLYGMLMHVFNGSVLLALDNLHPNKFEKDGYFFKLK